MVRVCLTWLPLIFCTLSLFSPSHAIAALTDADYRSHVIKLRAELPKGFHLVVERPFVIVGDEPADVLERRAKATVQWAVKRIRRQFFDKDLSEIVDIWLFKDRVSYQKHVKSLFGSAPSTPFGYYSPQHKALVMNISTGGGTLVHEIVHPFMAANFPKCPAWFNEGLASLYEQCSDNDGKIWGRTNWRLRGLQKAIQKKQLGTFEQLCSTTDREFYADEAGTNYSQARYLCYYLQQQGLLEKYYRTFRKQAKEDPTGFATLRQILKRQDLKQFQRDWETFVLKLRY